MIKHYSPVSKTYAKIAIPFVVFSFLLAGASVALAGGRTGIRGSDQSSLLLDEQREESIRKTSGSDPSGFCDLEVVGCSEDVPQQRNADRDGGLITQAGRMGDGEREDEITKTVAGYAIGSYATLPTHEATVKAIYDAMPEIKDKFDADEYIKSKRPNSPVRGGMVERASIEYGVDMKLMLALMQNDSAFGTAGLGARTRNPGNIANRDDGHTHTYPSWEDGVRGIARWLAKKKV